LRGGIATKPIFTSIFDSPAGNPIIDSETEPAHIPNQIAIKPVGRVAEA
jgi:hypothetical protein